MTTSVATAVLPAFRDYLDACNARDWARARTFVRDPLRVQGVVTTAADWVAGIARLTAEHPGFVWTVGETVVEGGRLAARLRTPSGLELAIYTWRDGQIAEYWGSDPVVTQSLKVVDSGTSSGA